MFEKYVSFIDCTTYRNGIYIYVYYCLLNSFYPLRMEREYISLVVFSTEGVLILDLEVISTTQHSIEGFEDFLVHHHTCICISMGTYGGIQI